MRFALDVEELTSTLLTFDFVDLDKEVQAKLLESIEKEGIEERYGKILENL